MNNLQFRIYNSLKKHFTFYIVHSKLNKGFTLIEILVVVAIIGVLSSFLMANFIGARERARDSKRKTDLAQIQSALEFFRSDHGYYPPSTGGNKKLKICGPGKDFTGIDTTTTYMKDIPCDPYLFNGMIAYKYEALGCNGDKCTAYTLTAQLDNKNDAQAVPQIVSGKTIYVYILQNP